MDLRTDTIKKVGIDHYGNERRLIRKVVCDHFHGKIRVLELFGSGGNMTDFYKQNLQSPTIVGVDIAPGTDYQMNNRDFVFKVLPTLEPFDVIDFDAYGNPNQLIRETLEITENLYKHKEFVIITTDGLGLHMKLKKDVDFYKYFLTHGADVPDLRHPWQHHLYLTDNFFKQLGKLFHKQVTCLSAIQSKGKNYVFGAYLLR